MVLERMVSEAAFKDRLNELHERMRLAADAAGRDAVDIKLLPVTKFHPVEAVHFAVAAGLCGVGENRVQEAEAKRKRWQAEGEHSKPLAWELIGHLQSNKARAAVAVFDRIQSVDSLKLIRKLGTAAAEMGKTLPVLLQFNTGEDPAKYGFTVAQAEAALEATLAEPSLKLEGLMTIAPFSEDPAVARQAFAGLRALRDALSAKAAQPLPELSMGMTGDLEIAIAEGSTQIRVGTALYGERSAE